MWKYNYTDEMYTGQYRNQNELYHHKYIKKVKVNGKWRYYYKDNVEKEYANAKRGYQSAEDKYIVAKSNYEVNREMAADRLSKGELNGANYSQFTGHLSGLKDTYRKRETEYTMAGKRLVEAKKEYRKTTLSRISAKVAVKGLNFVSDLVSSLKKKIKKK